MFTVWQGLQMLNTAALPTSPRLHMNVVRKVCRVDGFSYAALLPCRECTRDPYVLVASSVWARAMKLVEVGVSLFQGSSRTAIPLAIIATMRGYSLLI